MNSLRPLVLASVLAATIVPAVHAQEREREPIARFAADVRGVLPRYPKDQATPTAINVSADNLPARGLGLSFGAHVYPLRMGKVTLGLGGELLFTRGKRTAAPATAGGADGPTVVTRFSALSPQISLNFGSRSGWSYVSAGLGRGQFTIEREAAPVAEATSKPRTLNYGGGARWFASPHLAFTFDIRFHKIADQAAITGRPAYGARKITVLSAGVSFK